VVLRYSIGMRQLILIAHNLRSTHNVGSLLRTADGLGLSRVYLTGYTPYPLSKKDARLPHLARKINDQIAKTALGAEKADNIFHADKIEIVIQQLQHEGFTVAALEQATNSVKLPDFKPPAKLAIIVGREVEGLESSVIEACDLSLEIPMLGKKESFNVAVAAAMALYHLRFGV
jgi:23S rRNA (guanosine2251-2'-O)-methyltransferase